MSNFIGFLRQFLRIRCLKGFWEFYKQEYARWEREEYYIKRFNDPETQRCMKKMRSGHWAIPSTAELEQFDAGMDRFMHQYCATMAEKQAIEGEA